MPELTRIALAGEGGQGVQVVGEILAEAAYEAGKEAIYIPNFGVEQRGGVSIAFVQISDKQIGSPKFKKADLLVVLSPRGVERTKSFLTHETKYIYDSSAIEAPHINDLAVGIQSWDTVAPEAFANPVGFKEGEGEEIKPPGGLKHLYGIPAARVATEEMSPRVFNIMILGAVMAAAPVLSDGDVKRAIEKKLGDKFDARPELRDLNYKAYERGKQLVKEMLKEGVHA